MHNRLSTLLWVFAGVFVAGTLSAQMAGSGSIQGTISDQSGAVVVKGWRDEGLPVSSDVGDAGYPALRAKAGM